MDKKIQEDLALTPNEVRDLLIKSFNAVAKGIRIMPICFCGCPGIGKSQIVQQATQEVGGIYSEFRVALATDSSDVTGLPAVIKFTDSTGSVYDAKTIYSRPEILPFMVKDEQGNFKSDDKLHVLFFDEFNRGADPSITNAIFQMLTEYKLGQHKLYPNTMIVLAINPEGTGYMVNEMCPALINRINFIYTKPNLAQWTDYAKKNKVNPLVIDFVNNQPAYFSESGVSDVEEADKRFPTPRAWVNLANMVDALAFDFTKEQDTAFASKVLSGIVGMDAAVHFVNFCKTSTGNRLISGFDIVHNYNTDPALKSKICQVDASGNRVYTADKVMQTANQALSEVVDNLREKATNQDLINFLDFVLDITAEQSCAIIDKLTKGDTTGWLSWFIETMVNRDPSAVILGKWKQAKNAAMAFGMGSQKKI